MATSTLFKSATPNILIAVDGSTFSEHAMQGGVEMAQKLDASLILVSVVDITDLVGNAAVGGVIDSAALKVYADEAKSVVDELSKKYPYAKTKKITEEGLPAETILKLAGTYKADVIVMGTHGRKGLGHLLLGSVAENVVRHSLIPVLVIPSKKENK
ncbi:MAG TPA: universal stress protein [Bacteroidia bacterium]|jgi:nucleotide-binding universal stress UspA family protein|nr:universal stress protein [Bacteroidia bacterium]